MLTPAGIEQAIAQHTRDPFLVLLSIDHPSFAQPERFVRNHLPLVSQGRTFRASFFTLTLPGDGPEGPEARLVVANVSRQIGRRLEAIAPDGRCTATIELVLASMPDTIQRRWTLFLRRAVWDAMTVQAAVGRRPLYDEPFPFRRVTTRNFRGISPDG